MAIKKLLRMGDERLLNKSAEVKDFGNPQLQTVIDDLIDSMRHYGGAGIAGPQIGYFLRVFVIEVNHLARYPDAENIPLTVIINPEIELLTTEQDELWEGCLSVPGYRGLVPRYTHLKYRAYDRHGKPFEREVTGFHAHAIQHETDHLDGILFPMRVKNMKNFGCDDMLWQRSKKAPYPESLKQKIREQWDL